MKNKGITILSLIVTIIIMLILAGVSIKTLAGDNGIITKAQEAAFKQELNSYKEEFELYKVFGGEWEETWKYEKVKGYISGLSSKYKIGEENSKIGIINGELVFRDTGNERKTKWAEETGCKIVSEDAKISFQVVGEGELKGLPLNQVIETKIGAEYNLSAIEESLVATNITTGNEENVKFQFDGWYEEGELIYTGNEISLEVVEDAEYEIRFKSEPTIIRYIDEKGEEKNFADYSEILGGYASREDIVKVEIGKCVKKISQNAFANCVNLEDKIIIREGTTLGSATFNNTGIEKLIIEDEITVPVNSFSNCNNLENVIIGDDVILSTADWTAGSFKNCPKLKEVQIGENATIGVNNGGGGHQNNWALFEKCDALENITVKSIKSIANYGFLNVGSALKGKIIINEGAKKISGSAFYGCDSITKVVLPETLTTIEGNAFKGCSKIETAVLPESINYIGEGAFNQCINLSDEIIIREGTTLEKGAFNNTGIEKLTIEDEINIPVNSFVNCVNLGKTIIGNNVILTTADWTIGSFANCSNLKEVEIGENATIGITNTGIDNRYEWALFKNCEKLEKVTVKSIKSIANCGFLNVGSALKGEIEFNEGIKSIGNEAFFECVNMKCDASLLPETINSIGGSAFLNCKNLSGILTIKENATLGKSAFSGSGIEKLIVGENVKLPEPSFRDCKNLKEVILEDGVTVELYAYGSTFENCTALKKVTMGENIKMSNPRKGGNCFGGCTSLEEVTVKSLSEVCINAFASVGPALKGTIKINEGVTSIGKDAFKECGNIEEIIFPSTLTQIEDNAFQNCTNMKCDASLLPKTINSIGSSAFLNCKNLSGILTLKEDSTLGKSAFSGSGIEKLIVGENVKLPEPSFRDCKNLKEVILEDGVTVELYAYGSTFENCTALKKVTMGENIKMSSPRYNPNCFGGCTALEEVTVKSLSMVGKNAFLNVGEALKGIIIINEDVTQIGENAFNGCTNVEAINFDMTQEQYDAIEFGTNWHKGISDEKINILK